MQFCASKTIKIIKGGGRERKKKSKGKKIDLKQSRHETEIVILSFFLISCISVSQMRKECRAGRDFVHLELVGLIGSLIINNKHCNIP